MRIAADSQRAARRDGPERLLRLNSVRVLPQAGVRHVGHMFVRVPSVPFQVHVLFYTGSLITDRVRLVSSVLPLCKYWLGSSP
jgi:hypothetical protein